MGAVSPEESVAVNLELKFVERPMGQERYWTGTS